MKALFCPDCWDMVILTFEKRSCRCGKVTGVYVDRTYAVVNGEGISMALGNGDFDDAMTTLANLPDNLDRKGYQEKCKLNYVWMRPHTGLGNPHTNVDRNLIYVRGIGL